MVLILLQDTEQKSLNKSITHSAADICHDDIYEETEAISTETACLDNIPQELEEPNAGSI